MKIVKKMKLKSWLLLFLMGVFAFSACGSDTRENGSNNAIEMGESQTTYETEESQATYEIEESQTIFEIEASEMNYIFLPPPEDDGDMSVESALANRRSHRSFLDRALSLEQLSQILWAAYGITSPIPDNPNLRGGLRTTPSAGALFPLEIYVIIGNVDGIEPGVYRYSAAEHKILQVVYGDVRDELYEAALSQSMVREAPISVFYSAVFERTTDIYGERGIMYVYMEIGHSAQNVYLQVEALGLGTCAIGAFTNDRVRQILHLPDNEEPLYLMPIGYSY